MILVWMISILLIGGVACWLVAQRNQPACKWTALVAVIAAFLLPIIWYLQHVPAAGNGNAWLIDYQLSWIPAFGISFHLAMDGLSFVMILLTALLGILAVLCSWNEIREKTGFYFFNLLWTLAGIAGVFVAIDLFLFYFFWEVMLVPMYFLIAIWGDFNRRHAAYKFFIFTQTGGLLMLLSILALYFIHGQQNSGYYTFDYFALLNTAMGNDATARWIMLGFLIAFVIKLPMVPLHSWLPDAHSEAPTAGSLILAGLLLKTGAYGIIRFVLPLFPIAAAGIAWWAMLLGVVGIIYGALLAYAQTDLKRLIAYTSVSHMGFVLLGIFAFRQMALQGVVMQLLTHGVSTGALFVLAGMLKERLHTRDINQMGGLWTAMPHMGALAMVFVMASLGLPLLGNFIAEFLILLGAFEVSPVLSIIASFGLVLSALYALRIMQKVFFGQIQTITDPPADINVREWIIMACLTLAIVFLGLYPQPIFNIVNGVVQQVVRL